MIELFKISTPETSARIWDMNFISPEVAENSKHTVTESKELKCNLSDEQQKTFMCAKQNISFNLHHVSKAFWDAADKS